MFYWDATNENLLLKNTVNLKNYIFLKRLSFIFNYSFATLQIKLPRAVKQMLLSLVELGWLFHKVQKHCESPKNDSTCGLAARAFYAALQEELSMNAPFNSISHHLFLFSLNIRFEIFGFKC